MCSGSREWHCWNSVGFDGPLTALFEAATVFPLTLFFLAGGPPLLARMAAALAGSERSTACLRVTEAIRAELGRYFGTIALINLGLGLATAAAMAALGMPNALLWGTIAHRSAFRRRLCRREDVDSRWRADAEVWRRCAELPLWTPSAPTSPIWRT